MRTRIRMALMAATVGVVGGVGLAAALLNPSEPRSYLVVVAIAAAAQAVSSQPRDLVPALLLALVPVAGLISDGSLSGLGPLLVVMLLLAGEINAWICEGPERMLEDESLLGRAKEAAVLSATGLGVAALLRVAGRPELPGGTWAVLAGAAGIVGIAAIAFPPASDGSPRAKDGVAE